MTCLHVVLEHVNDSSLTFFVILVSVQRSEESFRYNLPKVKVKVNNGTSLLVCRSVIELTILWASYRDTESSRESANDLVCRLTTCGRMAYVRPWQPSTLVNPVLDMASWRLRPQA